MNVHDFSVKTISGQEKSLKDYAGKPLLIVNVASKCGLTPQYEGLENLFNKYKDRGLQILGVPCNQFAGQEPGSEEQIAEFCKMNYGVTFDLASKVEVNGSGAHPLYAYLTGTDSGFPGVITWNFEKFLIGKDGKVIKRFTPKTLPGSADVTASVEAAL